MKKFVNINNSVRDEKYTSVIKEIAQKGICPFCENQLEQFHKKPIEKRTNWIITDNMYPYKPTKCHILLIHNKHIEHVREITTEAWVELQMIINEVTKNKEIAGGTFILRFGDTHFTGSSVSHLHAHIIQSNPDDSTYNNGLLTRIG